MADNDEVDKDQTEIHIIADLVTLVLQKAKKLYNKLSKWLSIKRSFNSVEIDKRKSKDKQNCLKDCYW